MTHDSKFAFNILISITIWNLQKEEWKYIVCVYMCARAGACCLPKCVYAWILQHETTSAGKKVPAQELEYLCSSSCSCCAVFSHSVVSDPTTIARHTPLSMRFPSQEYWSGLPFPTLGDLSDLGIEPVFLVTPALAGRFFTSSATGEAPGRSLACDILSLCWGPSLGSDRLVWGSESSHTALETVVLNLSWGGQSFYELMKTLWRMALHKSKLLVLKAKRF